MSVFFISKLLALSIFGNENSSLEQLMKSTGFQNPNPRLSCLLSSSLTTTQLRGYVLFLRMICIKHNFGMKKGRSTGKTDRIRPGKAPGRPAYTSWAGRPRPFWSRFGLQKFRETLRRFAYLCFIESVLWKGSEKRKKIREQREKVRERKKRKRKEKKCIRREEKNKWRDSMVREVQRDITSLFEQYSQFQPCAIRQQGRRLCLEVNIFVCLCTCPPFLIFLPLNPLHYEETLMIIGSEGKQSLEGFLDLTINVYTLLASPIAPLYIWETFGRWEYANNNRIATYIERHEGTCARIFTNNNFWCKNNRMIMQGILLLKTKKNPPRMARKASVVDIRVAG